MLDSQSWKEIREVFEAVVDLSPEEAQRQIDEMPLSDVVRSEVLQLLHVAHDHQDFLEDSNNSIAIACLEQLVQQVHPLSPSDSPNDFEPQEDSGSHAGQDFLDASDNPLNNSRYSQQQLLQLQETIQRCFPNYRIRKLLGSGGQGVVFLASDLSLHRDVALKVLRPSSTASGGLEDDSNSDFSGTSSQSTYNKAQLKKTQRHKPQSLLEEARAAAAIDHPNVAAVYSVDELESLVVLSTQYVRGQNLKHFLSQRFVVPPTLAANIANQVSKALNAAHQTGVIHRDIKPANILLNLNADASPNQPISIKVIDFGLAEKSTSRLGEWAEELETKTADASSSFRSPKPASQRVGSLPYISPEQWEGEACNERTDIYAIGITLYQMLVGRVPYVGSPPMVIRQILHSDPIPPRRTNPEIPRDLESIVLKAIARRPEDRYVSAKELSDDLERFLDGRPTLARPLGRFETLRRWYQRDWKTAYSLTAFLVTLLFATIALAGLSTVVWRKNARLLAAQQQTRIATAKTLINATAETVPLAVTQLPLDDATVTQHLQQAADSFSSTPEQRMNAMLGLSHLGHASISGKLAKHLVQTPTPASLVKLAIAELRRDQEQLAATEPVLQQIRSSPSFDQEPLDVRIRFALLQFFLLPDKSQPLLLEEYCAFDATPMQRTAVITSLDEFAPDLDTIQTCVNQANSPEIAYTVLVGLGTGDTNYQKIYSKEQWQTFIKEVNRQFSGNPSVIAASRWLALQTDAPWDEKWVMQSNDFIALPEGINMIRIKPFTAKHGVLSPDVTVATHPPHDTQITYAYCISDAEITREVFQQFLAATDPETVREKRQVGLSTEENQTQQGQLNWASTSPNHPVTNVSWNSAAAFCNWLSRKHGRKTAYNWVASQDQYNNHPAIKDGWFQLDSDSNGFRLPTESEWEHATRAYSETEFFFGDNLKLAHNWLHFSSRRLTPALPVRRTMPNPFGLHETIGNVWEWTHDWMSDLGQPSYRNYFGPSLFETILASADSSRVDSGNQPTIARTFRGGGVNTTSGEPSSHSRGFLDPRFHYENLGFRIAYRADK